MLGSAHPGNGEEQSAPISKLAADEDTYSGSGDALPSYYNQGGTTYYNQLRPHATEYYTLAGLPIVTAPSTHTHVSNVGPGRNAGGLQSGPGRGGTGQGDGALAVNSSAVPVTTTQSSPVSIISHSHVAGSEAGSHQLSRISSEIASQIHNSNVEGNFQQLAGPSEPHEIFI